MHGEDSKGLNEIKATSKAVSVGKKCIFILWMRSSGKEIRFNDLQRELYLIVSLLIVEQFNIIISINETKM
jgi:hypothetical protein